MGGEGLLAELLGPYAGTALAELGTNSFATADSSNAPSMMSTVSVPWRGEGAL